MHTRETLRSQKATLRTHLRQIRSGLPASLRLSHSRLIHGHLYGLDEVITAKSAFIYISYASEVDTHAIIRRFLDEGKSLAVPRIIDANHMISVPFTSWEDLKTDTMGIMAPETTTVYPGPLDIAITPGLGFTIAGNRIGFGRGYYDKWFRANAVKTKIALAYEAQILEQLPTGRNDIPVDIIVTEKRVIRVINPGNR